MLGEPNNRLAYRRRDECVMCRTTQFRYIIRVTLAASRGRLLMSDSDQTKQPPPTGHDVPELVDTYRSQREALQAQANQLARLRDEIRAAAEREATDIVDAARRDVRQILVKARRELLVLTAQVQAAAEAAGGEQQQKEGNSQRERVLAEAARVGLALEHEDLGAARDLLVGARQDVQRVLQGARPDLDALNAEMTLLRGSTSETTQPDGSVLVGREAPDSSTAPAESKKARTLELSLSPDTGPSWFALTPRLAAFVGAFAVLGVIAMIGVTWWRSAPATDQPAQSELAVTEPQPAAPIPADVPLPNTADAPAAATAAALPPVDVDPTRVSLRLEATRDVWVRTTIGGQADIGRLLQSGDTREVTAASDVLLRIGDAGALLISVNGAEATPAGPDGQVMNRAFAPEAGSTPLVAPAADAPPQTASLAPAVELPQPPPFVPTDLVPLITAPEVASTLPPAAEVGPVEQPAPAAASDPALVEPVAGIEAAEGELVPAAQRWFALYHQGQHLEAAGSQPPTITDDRGEEERPAQGAQVTQRFFDDVRVQLVGDNALYTARMTEREQIGNGSTQYVSLVSQVWMRRAGAWRLVDVRLVSAGRLSQGNP